MKVMALEELEIRDLDQVTHVYAALLCTHIRLLKYLMPRFVWKEVPVVIVFEQNTYVNALVDVKNLIEQSLVRSGFKILFYSKWSPTNNKYMLGKHVSAKTKLDMVLSTVSAISRGDLSYCDSVMTVGWLVLSETTRKARVLESSVCGTSKGSGCSNATGSNLDVSMYRHSQRGVNLATDVTARLMEKLNLVYIPSRDLGHQAHVTQGKISLGKLREEMSEVKLTDSVKGTTVTTGGKRSVNGEYTRDDMLSAFLLLCHTRDEIHRGDTSVKICGEAYYG